MKICPGCMKEYEDAEFISKRGNGVRRFCSRCAAQRSETVKKSYRRHEGTNYAHVKSWREKNPEKLRGLREKELERIKLARQADPVKFRQMDRKCDLKRHYALTVEQYDARLAKQNGVCGICEQPCNSGRRLAVDHDHKCCPGKNSCGKCVRGLLCGKCNLNLERFDEVADYVARVQRYLAEFSTPKEA